MTPSKTLSFFALLAFITSAVWLALVWHWPWADLWRDPDTLPLAQAAVQMAVLPEIAAAFLAGGLLALASTALQQVVHNPLASDSTLAVAGGAQLALMLVTLFFPAAGLFGSFWVAFVGAVAAMLLVLLVAGAGGANALALILAGLLANMVFAAIAAVISQFYSDLLLGIMVWGAGSLLQDGWATVTALLWTSLAAALALALLYRPLTLLALDDEQARRLGVISFAGLAGRVSPICCGCGRWARVSPCRSLRAACCCWSSIACSISPDIFSARFCPQVHSAGFSARRS